MAKKYLSYIIILITIVLSLLIYFIFFTTNLPKSTIFAENITANEWIDFKKSLENDKEREISFSIILPENKASYPKNLAPPEFEWDKKSNVIWFVEIELQEGKKISIVTKTNIWRPSYELWNAIRKNSIGRYNKITIYGFDGKKITKSSPVLFRISKYSIDKYLVYRLVEYEKQFVQVPRLYYRDVSELESHEVLKNLDFCFGCHVFSPDDKSMSMATRRVINGSTQLGEDLAFSDKETLRIKDELGGYNIFAGSQMSAWVPNKNQIILSLVTNSQRNTKFSYINKYPLTADFAPGIGDIDIKVYDYKKEILKPLKGASDPEAIEEWPEISPDGKYVMFQRQVFYPELGDYAYDSDIYLVPFNDGLGGEAKKLEGASEKGIREYFARFSPDGKWVVFNRVDGYGDTFIENTDLYLIPAQGGTPRKLSANSDEMDSAIVWSKNSKWITFVSRRYINESRLFISEIDENGNASPAVKLPNTEQYNEVGLHHPFYTNDKRSLFKILKNFEEFSIEFNETYPPDS